NNLFGHAAYDSDVEKNASRYFGVNSSIYSHAKYYISGSYANPFKFQFHGSYFGNKANGMNVSYASDPYWGEKAAQFYMNIDSSFGSKDYNSVALGIKTNYEDVKVYQYDSTNSQILYSTGKNPDFAFVILDAFSNAEGDWYKVQSEATLNAESKVDTMYYYDYSNYVAYIKQSDVQVLMNMDNLGQKELIKVTFDANGGMFQDDTGLITYGLEINRMPVIEEPTKEKALCVGCAKEIVPVTDEVTYVAQYKDIESIEMETYPLQYFEWNDRIDIDGGVVKVNFTDGSKKELELTTSMVSNFDLKIEGEQEVIVTVGGKTTTYPITVDKELDTIRQELKDEIVLVLEEMSEIETLSDEQAERVITLKKRMDEYMVPYLTQPQLRALDKIIYKAINHRIHYVIYKNDLDASVSGLSLAIDLGNSLENKLLKDTIKLIVKGSIPKIHEKEMTTLAEGNNFKVIDTFTIKTQ
ncbi:MAG: bacterial Ig-like domain-containing protein, partial [Longicatena sp.]